MPELAGMAEHQEWADITSRVLIVFQHSSGTQIGKVLVSATGPGNQPGIWVWTAKTDQLSSRPVQKPDLRHPGGLTMYV